MSEFTLEQLAESCVRRARNEIGDYAEAQRQETKVLLGKLHSPDLSKSQRSSAVRRLQANPPGQARRAKLDQVLHHAQSMLRSVRGLGI